MKFLWSYLKKQQKDIYLGISTKAFGSILELFLPFIMSMIIDEIVPTKEIPSILWWSLGMILCAFGAWRLNIFANRMASKVARNATQEIRHDLFAQSLYLSCHDTDAFTIPSLETRLTSDTYHIHRMVGMLQRMGIRGPIIVLGGLIITFFMEPSLALVLLSTIPFIGILIYIRAKQGIPLYRQVQKVNDEMVGVVRENAQGIRIIKALSKTSYEHGRYQNVNQKLKNTTIHAHSRMAIVSPGMNLILNLGQVAVILVGANLVANHLSSTGKIIAFMSYFTIMLRSMMMVGRIFIMSSQGIASCHRIEEVMTYANEKSWAVASYPESDPQYEIEFKDVTFRYLNVKNNLSHISFRLKKGETLGIIGATGSGKTTMLSLLLRLYDVSEGAIYIKGKDIRTMTPNELRKQFGVVMQNDFLFRDTIRENIRFGRSVSDEEIVRATKIAQANDFIETLPHTFDYELEGKGQNLSGGQRQRILLSRAFANHPEILLLDDSSSALDYNTDAKLRKALNASFQDTTMIIVAQRISSIKNCDHILILEEGHIHASGTHDTLMEDCALYQSIYESQMGGALFD